MAGATRLTLKMEAFARDWVLHGDACKAYRAHYNTKRMKSDSIRVAACRLLKHKLVAALVKELQTETKKIADEEFGINARWLLDRFVETENLDPGDIHNPDGNLKPIHEWPEVWRRNLSSFEVTTLGESTKVTKIKWLDKGKNREMLGRHVDIQAFKDNVDVNNKITLADFADSLPED